MTPRRHAFVTILATCAALALGCGSDGPASTGGGGTNRRPTLPQNYRASGHAAAGDVFVHLFEWKWNDIAAECENVLGPAGYRAVQVSPPQEHAVITNHPWWQRYQPVSYSLERSRSGSEAEFASMVARCGAAGVDIYVDAVINHMTAGAGTGSAGTQYTKYDYPGVWTPADFHPPCGVDNYQVAAIVQDCELLGLADLNTSLEPVRQKLANYLVALARLGVDGFRIDAAKHMQPVELDSILDLANRTLASEGRPLPYYFGEVIDYRGEAVRREDYFGLAYGSGGAADITEFKFRYVWDKFVGLGGQNIGQLNPNGPPGAQFSPAAWDLMPSDKAVVFLDNHDTQRSDGAWYQGGQTYRLAMVWMLAQPYGYPSVMSSYAFDRSPAGRDRGPPSDASGSTNDVACASILTATAGQWVCEHRDPYVLPMVGFRRVTAGEPVENWSGSAKSIHFQRGDEGFVAISQETLPLDVSTVVSLPPGVYCDILTGGLVGAACAGTELVVEANGRLQYSLQPNTALAIHVGARKP